MVGKAENKKRCNFLYLIILLVPFLFLVSCSTPPPDAENAGFLRALNYMLNGEERPGSLLEIFDIFRKIYGAKDLVTAFHAGDSIYLTGNSAVPDDKTLIYTIGNNRIRVNRDLYVTTGWNGKWYYSLDSETWYAMANDQKKGILNIQYDYPLQSGFDLRTGRLEIHFVWKASKSDYAVPVDMIDKGILELEEGMVFRSTDKKENTLDLSKAFLKIPRGTELLYNISFSGALVKSKKIGNVTVIEIQKDFFFYTSDVTNLRMGISFDGNDWNSNIFSFRYIQTGQFACIGPGQIIYNRDMELRYSFDENE